MLGMYMMNHMHTKHTLFLYLNFLVAMGICHEVSHGNTLFKGLCMSLMIYLHKLCGFFCLYSDIPIATIAYAPMGKYFMSSYVRFVM